MDDDVNAPPGLQPAQLRQINRLATAARMVASLAHELNNSLQVVSGLVELLGDRADIPADAIARIRKIGGQADKAGGAIRQVVDYTREAGERAGTVDLSALAEQVLALRRYNLGRAGITATAELPSNPVTNSTSVPRGVISSMCRLRCVAAGAAAADMGVSPNSRQWTLSSVQ